MSGWKNRGYPDKIKCLQDVERIPFTTKKIFGTTIPLGSFCTFLKRWCGSLIFWNYWQPHRSRLHENDLDMWSDLMARLIAKEAEERMISPRLLFGLRLVLPARWGCIMAWSIIGHRSAHLLQETTEKILC